MRRAFLIAGCCVVMSACAPNIRSIKNGEKEVCVKGVLAEAETIDEGNDVFLMIRENDQTLDAVHSTPEPFKYKTGEPVRVCGAFGTYKTVKTNKVIVRKDIFILTSLTYESQRK